MTKKQTTIEGVSALPDWLQPEALRLRLAVDTDTGWLTWLSGPRAGQRAGNPMANGYRQVRIGKGPGGRVYEHRLVWALVHGEWPEDMLDHRNGNRADNRLANLRPATRSQNGANRGAKNAARLKGTHRSRSGRWIAKVVCDGRQKQVGTFDTEEAAHAAYMTHAQQVFGEYARAT